MSLMPSDILQQLAAIQPAVTAPTGGAISLAAEIAPRLDDGDLLGATELSALTIKLPGGQRPDDDTLYRSLFSFIDPLIRAEFLIGQLFEPAADIAALTATPQDVSVGVTFHFMHPRLRQAALARVFI